jgi:hypothetical protein
VLLLPILVGAPASMDLGGDVVRAGVLCVVRCHYLRVVKLATFCSGGGWRLLRVACRPATALGAVQTSGQWPWDGGHGEEHCGVWCHGGIHTAEVMCRKAGLATLPWWIGFYDRGMVNSAKALHRSRSLLVMSSSLDAAPLVGGIVEELLHLPRCFEPQTLRVKT